MRVYPFHLTFNILFNLSKTRMHDIQQWTIKMGGTLYVMKLAALRRPELIRLLKDVVSTRTHSWRKLFNYSDFSEAPWAFLLPYYYLQRSKIAHPKGCDHTPDHSWGGGGNSAISGIILALFLVPYRQNRIVGDRWMDGFVALPPLRWVSSFKCTWETGGWPDLC